MNSPEDFVNSDNVLDSFIAKTFTWINEDNILKPLCLRTKTNDFAILKIELLRKSKFHQKASKMIKLAKNMQNDIFFHFISFVDRIQKKENPKDLANSFLAFFKDGSNYCSDMVNLFIDFMNRHSLYSHLIVLFFFIFLQSMC